MINRKTKRAIARLASFATVQLDEILWEYAKFYRKMMIIDFSDCEWISEEFVAVATCLVLEESGDASRHSDPAGNNITFKATQKFLRSIGHEAGSLVTIRREGLVWAGSVDPLPPNWKPNVGTSENSAR
jgi:hypothetical protein